MTLIIGGVALVIAVTGITAVMKTGNKESLIAVYDKGNK